MPFGRKVIAETGRPIQVTADGRPDWKVGGIQVDWATVAAVAGADVTLADETVVKIGDKYLRFGQVMTKITATGKFGPYDSAAVDGRQLLARGNVFILNETVVMSELNSDNPAVLRGGELFEARVLQSGVGAASLAAGPTLATLEAAMPTIHMVR